MRRSLRLVVGELAKKWQPITGCLLATITIFSLLPLSELPEFPGNDKTHHFIAYAALMFPVALRRPRLWLGIGAVLLLWSGGIELLQPYVNRYGEWLDLAANAGGLMIGATLGLIFNNYFLNCVDNNESINL